MLQKKSATEIYHVCNLFHFTCVVSHMECIQCLVCTMCVSTAQQSSLNMKTVFRRMKLEAGECSQYLFMCIWLVGHLSEGQRSSARNVVCVFAGKDSTVAAIHLLRDLLNTDKIKRYIIFGSQEYRWLLRLQKHSEGEDTEREAF